MIKQFLRKDIFFCVALGANVSSPNEWMKYAEKEMRGLRSHAEMTMTVETENWTRVLEIESDVEGQSLALSTIKSPAKDKGIRTLRIDKNMWNYFPKTKRKVAVSSSMLLSSWMGSDFTNDDILKASSMYEDYNHTFGKDENGYKVIENTAKGDSKVMWPKIVSYNSKEDCLPRIYKYYDKSGSLKRLLTFDKVKKFDGHLMPTHWEMRPEDDSKKKTTLIYNNLKFNVNFKANHFTQQNLASE